MKDWLKGLGTKLVDAGRAKFEDEKQRRAEPQLTDEEKRLFGRFLDAQEHLHQIAKDGLPERPRSETGRNRREIRALLSHPAFDAAVRDAEKRKKESLERERKRREEEARIARENRQRQLAEDLARIEAYYGNELNSYELRLEEAYDSLDTKSKGNMAEFFLEARDGQKIGSDNNAKSAGGIAFELAFDATRIAKSGRMFTEGLRNSKLVRTLRDIPEGQRAILRLSEILEVLGFATRKEVYSVALPILWNEGKTQLTTPSNLTTPTDKAAFKKAVTHLIETRFGTPESAAELVQGKCRSVLEGKGDSEEKAVLNRYLYSGTRWLTSDGIKPLIPKGVTDKALRLGAFADGKELYYDRNESLITIAPPGTGKSTSHVLRNLLYLNGPAVVLDIKGDMFADTADWRGREVGKVYRFAPNDRDTSLRFNPLDFISTDPDEAYEESERLAELLTVPAEEGEYFDERAIQVIRAMVLYVALTRTGAERCMESVLDLLSGVNNDPLAAERAGQPGEEDAPFNALISDLMMHEMPTLRRMGSSLNKMPDKQREGVFDTARTKLKVWESPAIARLTRETTFRPEMLRGERATLYLCVELGDIKRFASVLRVLLGSCISTLCKGTPVPNAEAVTFFLDELPRLKRMDVVEEALDVGRGFGVRLWMFAQNIGQLETAYPNAKGMVGNCLAQCYMNPDAERSKWLSSHLGVRRGLLDGSERPLVESFDLTGHDYADKVVVMLNGMDNALLTKRPYYADPEAMKRVQKAPEVAALAG
ncbi:type IV secretory system conjugative DNA transfer family protein [Bradyrhizobium sp. Arg314]